MSCYVTDIGWYYGTSTRATPRRMLKMTGSRGNQIMTASFIWSPFWTPFNRLAKHFTTPEEPFNRREDGCNKSSHRNDAIHEAKPTKWGFKPFVLAGSSNGCTFDFSVYTGQFPSDVGLAYNSVMSLIKPASFVFGQFLHQSKILQGSVSHENWSMWNIPRKQKRLSPHTVKFTPKKDPRGSIRWIRDDPLVHARNLSALRSTRHSLEAM